MRWQIVNNPKYWRGPYIYVTMGGEDDTFYIVGRCEGDSLIPGDLYVEDESGKVHRNNMNFRAMCEFLVRRNRGDFKEANIMPQPFAPAPDAEAAAE